jgi:TatD DNase family protein
MGEIGLDYHYDFSPREVQRAVFRKQLEIAAESGKPVVIHTREAWADTMELLRQGSKPLSDVRGSETDSEPRPSGSGWRGIIHCFTGDSQQAREALDLGFCLAFGGVLTFPKADAVREAARITPEDRLLVETDCPYLAPAPHRGRRNEPAFVVEVARRLAEVRGATLDEIAGQTTRNFERLCLRGGAVNG